MNKAVLLGIVGALDKEFGLSVYVDSVEQGADTPCFLVTKVEGEMKRRLGNRYKMLNYYEIVYLTESEKPTMEQMDVEERLYNCLEFVVIDGSLTKTNNVSCSITDGVLHCLLECSFYVRKQSEQEKAMEHMVHETQLKG